jgi:hypothetical protein
MKKQHILTSAALVTTFILQSCSKDNVSQYSSSDGPCTDSISFSADIEPLISQNCTVSGCHDSGSSTGYEFISHGTIAANATIMLSAMRWESGVVPMPQGQPQLPDSLIKKFSCWIDQGKLDN